jgi:hypothetical protein
VNTQNQGQPSPQNLNARNATAANASYQQEAASELAQSPGQISQILLSRSKAGFEFGALGGNAAKNANLANNANNANQYEFGNLSANANLASASQYQNSELNQSNGQVSRTLAQQSR